MPEAPSAAPAAPSPAAQTASSASSVPTPASQERGPSNGVDLMAKLANLPKPGQQQAAPEPKPASKPATEAKKADPAKPEAKKADANNPFDLEVVSLEEPKQEVKQPEEAAPQELKPEAQTKWKELKSKATELDQIKPQYEALKQKIAELEATPNKLPPEVETEITELKKFKAAYDVENTPEYQDSVLKPWESNMRKIGEVVDYAGINMDKVTEAMKEQNTLARARAIREALASNPDGPELTSEEIGIVVRAADDLHANVFPKDRELREKALEIQNALKGQQETLTAKQREEHEASLSKASSELFPIIETKLKSLGIFNDQNLVESVKTARPADPTKEPMTAVTQAVSAKLLPAIILKYNELAAQFKDAKAALKARGESGASLGGGGGGSPEPKKSEEPDEGRSLMSSLGSLMRR